MNDKSVTTENYYCARCGKEWPDGQENCDHDGRDLVKERNTAIDKLAKTVGLE